MELAELTLERVLLVLVFVFVLLVLIFVFLVVNTVQQRRTQVELREIKQQTLVELREIKEGVPLREFSGPLPKLTGGSPLSLVLLWCLWPPSQST